mmetsp:Transcript_39277/g.76848  ORF Transcript_39277/g.76848 Transcript_39277/m.76848 type:complete len:255 (-) Transcript_39277:138-902(-)
MASTMIAIARGGRVSSSPRADDAPSKPRGDRPASKAGKMKRTLWWIMGKSGKSTKSCAQSDLSAAPTAESWTTVDDDAFSLASDDDLYSSASTLDVFADSVLNFKRDGRSSTTPTSRHASPVRRLRRSASVAEAGEKLPTVDQDGVRQELRSRFCLPDDEESNIGMKCAGLHDSFVVRRVKAPSATRTLSPHRSRSAPSAILRKIRTIVSPVPEEEEEEAKVCTRWTRDTCPFAGAVADRCADRDLLSLARAEQ